MPSISEAEFRANVNMLRERIEKALSSVNCDTVAIKVGMWNRKTVEKYQKQLSEYEFIEMHKGLLMVRRVH